MIKNVVVGKIYWFIDGEGGKKPRGFQVKNHYPEEEDIEEHCSGFVLPFGEFESRYVYELYETEKEALAAGKKAYKEDWKKFMEDTDTPEKLMSYMAQSLLYRSYDTIFYPEEIKKYAKEKIEEYFNIKVKGILDPKVENSEEEEAKAMDRIKKLIEIQNGKDEASTNTEKATMINIEDYLDDHKNQSKKDEASKKTKKAKIINIDDYFNK